MFSNPEDSRRDAADGAVDSWIDALAALNRTPLRSAARQQIRYAIDVRERYYVPSFHVAAYIVPLLKDGVPGSPQTYDLHTLATSSAKYAVPADRIIGRLVTASGLLSGLTGVSPVILATLLDAIIETGRLHWRSVTEPALERRPLDEARIAWRIGNDGRQRPHIDGLSESILIAAQPLWYVDPRTLAAGPVETALPVQVATQLANAPALTPAQARRAQISLRHVFESVGIAGPKAELDVRVIERDPTPVLSLGMFSANSLATPERFPTAELEFEYGGDIVGPNSNAREFRVTSNNGVSTWPRHRGFESDALAKLRSLGLAPLEPPYDDDIDLDRVVLRMPQSDDRRWIAFLGDTVPKLRREGWTVEIDPRFPYQIAEAGDEWYANLRETQPQWFEFDLGIDVEGQRIPLLPILVEALAENGIGAADDLATLALRSEPIFGRLPNGAYVALPPSRVARVLATLAELFEGPQALNEAGAIPLGPVRAAAMADLDRAVTVDWTNQPAFHDFIDAIASLEKRRSELPDTFKTELRPYQHDGVAWLQTLRSYGFGGVLADDMGLGKTVQLLAHLAIEKAANRLHAPVLIVAPTSVVPNWRAEIARFVPSMKVVSLTGADRAERFPNIEDADIALTTYALLPRDAEHLVDRDWSLVVLDEAQAIKNPRVKAAAVARQLRAQQRIALTGTPIENHLEELWSIYAFAVPGLLGERRRFAQLFRTPIEKRNDTLRRSALAGRLRPFLLRRTKDRVESELPPKTEIVQRTELTGAQRDLYETIRLAMHARVRDEVARRGLSRSRIVVLDALLKLRQVCCDPRLLKLPAAEGVHESQKLEALMEMLESLIEDGRRVLLFSQFTSMLDLIEPELKKRSIPYVELRGSTRDRETPVARFQRGEVPLFLISLKAGGTGLNLTAADTVIHYDPWWNPAVERQATDRAHRIGQEQHVFVYKLIAEGTVEERILELQAHKGALAANLFEEASNAPLRLDPDDIERLFA